MGIFLIMERGQWDRGRHGGGQRELGTETEALKEEDFILQSGYDSEHMDMPEDGMRLLAIITMTKWSLLFTRKC